MIIISHRKFRNLWLWRDLGRSFLYCVRFVSELTCLSSQSDCWKDEFSFSVVGVILSLSYKWWICEQRRMVHRVRLGDLSKMLRNRKEGAVDERTEKIWWWINCEEWERSDRMQCMVYPVGIPKRESGGKREDFILGYWREMQSLNIRIWLIKWSWIVSKIPS